MSQKIKLFSIAALSCYVVSIFYDQLFNSRHFDINRLKLGQEEYNLQEVTINEDQQKRNSSSSDVVNSMVVNNKSHEPKERSNDDDHKDEDIVISLTERVKLRNATSVCNYSLIDLLDFRTTKELTKTRKCAGLLEKLRVSAFRREFDGKLHLSTPSESNDNNCTLKYYTPETACSFLLNNNIVNIALGDSLARQFYQTLYIATTGEVEMGAAYNSTYKHCRCDVEYWDRKKCIMGNLNVKGNLACNKMLEGKMLFYDWYSYRHFEKPPTFALLEEIMRNVTRTAQSRTVVMISLSLGLHPVWNSLSFPDYKRSVYDPLAERMKTFYSDKVKVVITHLGVTHSGPNKPARYQDVNGNAKIIKFNEALFNYTANYEIFRKKAKKPTEKGPRMFYFDRFQMTKNVTSHDGLHVSQSANYQAVQLYLNYVNNLLLEDDDDW